MKHLVAILAHNHPELLPALVAKCYHAGATHIAIFNGSQNPNLFDSALSTIRRETPKAFEALSPEVWRGDIEWGNMLPFNRAALAEAERLEADYLSFWDSDLLPVRSDCFLELRKAVDAARMKYKAPDGYVCARHKTHHNQAVWPGTKFPSRNFLSLHAKGRNPWSELLENYGWNGQWVSHAFHPATTFGKFTISHLNLALKNASPEAMAFNKPVITPEETVLPTLANLAGVPVESPAFLRGVKWRPYWEAGEVRGGVPCDMVAIHPVARHKNFPLWGDNGVRNP